MKCVSVADDVSGAGIASKTSFETVRQYNRGCGWYFFNARHYDPETARFETADSVVDGEYDAMGWNRYTYAHGNPIRYKDPTGHLALPVENYGD